MQTFILDHELHISTQLLDSKRLNKQLTECHQIINIIQLNQKAWANHPCVLQWKNNVNYLFAYTQSVACECKQRGINHKHIEYYMNAGLYNTPIKPKWITDEFIKRHRQALLFKTSLKYAVYKFCFENNVTPYFVNTKKYSTKFYMFIAEYYTLFKLKINDVLSQYHFDKPFLEGKQKISCKIVDNAHNDYKKYLYNFGNLPHVLDYLWGV